MQTYCFLNLLSYSAPEIISSSSCLRNFLKRFVLVKDTCNKASSSSFHAVFCWYPTFSLSSSSESSSSSSELSSLSFSSISISLFSFDST